MNVVWLSQCHIRAMCPNMAFGSAPKPTMCLLVPPQNQNIFNTHLSYLTLKTVWAVNFELSHFVDTGGDWKPVVTFPRQSSMSPKGRYVRIPKVDDF